MKSNLLPHLRGINDTGKRDLFRRVQSTAFCSGSDRQGILSFCSRHGQISEYVRLLRSDERIQFDRPILVIAFMPNHSRKALLDELLGDVAVMSRQDERFHLTRAITGGQAHVSLPPYLMVTHSFSSYSASAGLT
jgi:hypothetical protein